MSKGNVNRGRQGRKKVIYWVSKKRRAKG